MPLIIIFFLLFFSAVANVCCDDLKIMNQGLYTPSGNTPIYYMSFTLSSFANSRKAADKSSAGVYSVNGAPDSNDPNFGIAITGIVDENSNCLPTRVDSNLNYESPEIVDGSNVRPAPETLILTVTASGLTVGTSYNMYQYADFSDVPSTQFNANSGNAASTFTFTATETTYKKTVTIQSNQIAAFRTVATTAP